MSRPTDYSDELAELICLKMADGKSLRAICAEADMPDRSTVYRWMAANDGFATKCARARVIQADALEEDMADLEDRTLTGEIDPATARVVLSSKQWRASKMAPKLYGDKLALGGADDLPPIQVSRIELIPLDGNS